MKSLLFFILTLLFSSHLYSQGEEQRIKLQVGGRVDTTNQEVKEILRLYENYLNSRPDSIYDNPYWNKEEKSLYEDFDFSRSSIFQGGVRPNKLFSIYPPFVMSVEPLEEKYQIRILFASSNYDPQYVGSRVWCIQKLNAFLEDDHWVLENLIVELSKKWNNKSFGLIDYYYPPKFTLNESDVHKSVNFCNGIISRFNPSFHEPFRFYITNSIDDMGLLENFDFYFVGSTTGKSAAGKIISALGNAYYPHEFIHQLLPHNPDRSRVIDEGLAEFLGTKVEGTKYRELMSKLAKDLKKNGAINFESVVSEKELFNGYTTIYPAGAGICELVYSLQGDSGLLELMLADTSSYENIVCTLEEITQWDEEKIIERWQEVVLSYRN